MEGYGATGEDANAALGVVESMTVELRGAASGEAMCNNIGSNAVTVVGGLATGTADVLRTPRTPEGSPTPTGRQSVQTSLRCPALAAAALAVKLGLHDGDKGRSPRVAVTLVICIFTAVVAGWVGLVGDLAGRASVDRRVSKGCGAHPGLGPRGAPPRQPSRASPALPGMFWCGDGSWSWR